MRRLKRHHVGAAVLVAAALAVGTAVVAHRTSGPALPDPQLTPGVVLSTDPAVVCVSGYTATVRVGLTSAEQATVDKAYGWTYAPGKQEFDHLIPLELGGGNGVGNIWPQPIAQAHVKDGLENRLHALVCSHHLALQAAQSCIRSDWVACARKHP